MLEKTAEDVTLSTFRQRGAAVARNRNRMPAAQAARAGPTPNAEPINAPTVYANTVQGMVAQDDVSLVFLRNQPLFEPGVPVSRYAAQMPVAVVQMSYGMLKDLSVMTANLIEQIEAKRGAPLETEYTKRLKADAAKPADAD